MDLCVKYLPVFVFVFIGLAGCKKHRNDETSRTNLNRLSKAGSPYLQEHADNPVDWYEWGEEALAKAKRENKPLIISIGYSSCHWCHVMEEESFMDSAVARIMNQNFVAIKIDREERPDIDQIYLEAAQLISGNSGWPLNAFALPDGKPFYAATYFPKQQWIAMLQQVTEAYKKENMMVAKQAQELTKTLQETVGLSVQVNDNETHSREVYTTVLSTWQSHFDFEFGGLKGQQKFPLPAVWETLLQSYYLTKDEKAFDIVAKTLTGMANGGIYDHLGGGFARYATDAKWRVPHFEKMLYDNGQLVSLYAHAYEVTQMPRYAEVIKQTLDFVEREMTSPDGGFYASLNADSEGEEGKFYFWTKEEIKQSLDERHADIFMDYYNVTDAGNWEKGKNILFRSMGLKDFSDKKKLSEDACYKMLVEAADKLFQIRKKRVRPSTDTKILLSWNAIMLKGYVDAYFALGDPRYLKTALVNGRFLEKNMIREDGRLWRNFNNGKASTDAFLEDYALLSRAFIHLYQATFDIHWLEQAKSVASYAVKHFWDGQQNLFYYTSDESNDLIARKFEILDNVIPSSNAVMAEVLYTLGEYYMDESFMEMSSSMVKRVSKAIMTDGPYYANWTSVLGLMVYKPFEVAIVGSDALDKNQQLQRHYIPTSIFLGGDEENLPLLKNKRVNERTLIYVCRNKICKVPQEQVDIALKELLQHPSR